jgi:DNA-binding transcriptional LysR family regulator
MGPAPAGNFKAAQTDRAVAVRQGFPHRVAAGKPSERVWWGRASMDRLACDRIFLAIIERGSLSGAADKLKISTGQVSKALSRLEALLGVRLLNRTTRSVSATEVGRAYAEQIRALVDQLDDIDQTVRSAASAPTGRLAVSVPISFGTAVLAPLFAEFAGLYPLMRLDVSFSDRVVNLVDEGFDLALRIGALRDSNLVARKLCPIRVVTTASPGYLARAGTPQVPADVARHACILDGNLTGGAVWRFSGGVSVPVDARLRFANGEACSIAAEGGHGLVQGPSFVAGGRLRTGTLVPVLAAYEAEPLGLWAVYPAGRHLAAKVRVMVDFLVGRFHGTPPWDQGW